MTNANDHPQQVCLNDALGNLVFGLIAFGIGTAGAVGTELVILAKFEGPVRTALAVAVPILYVAANITGIVIAWRRLRAGSGNRP